MRLPRMNLQRFMVALIFLAIALWAGRGVLPEAMRRWRFCYARAVSLEAEAQSRHAEALRRAARSRPDEARMARRVAEEYEASAWKYRRALLIPWEFWSLGGDLPFDLLDRTSPKPVGRPGVQGKPQPRAKDRESPCASVAWSGKTSDDGYLVARQVELPRSPT